MSSAICRQYRVHVVRELDMDDLITVLLNVDAEGGRRISANQGGHGSASFYKLGHCFLSQLNCLLL